MVDRQETDSFDSEEEEEEETTKSAAQQQDQGFVARCFYVFR